MVFGGTNNKFSEGLNSMITASSLIKKQAENQFKAINFLSKWAADNDNTAIEDVMINTNAVFKIFNDKLIQLACEQEASVKELRKIEQTEVSIKNAEKKLERALEQEKKVEKDIKKYARSSSSFLFKTKKPTDLAIMHHDLNKAKSATLNAIKELSDVKAEMEVIKMFRFRKGMEIMSSAWRNFSNDISSIFACQQELIELVPAVATEDVREMFYEGASCTSSMVNNLQEKLNYPNSSNNDQKIETEISTSRVPHLIKKKQNFPSLSLTVSSEKDVQTSQMCSNFEKLSYDSDYSSCDNIENCGYGEKLSVATQIFSQDEKEIYQNLYPLLPPNPYNHNKHFNKQKCFGKSSNNFTNRNTFLSNTNIGTQHTTDTFATNHILRKSI